VSGHERERLSAYLDGELVPGERAAVEAHLQACPECTAFLAELAAVDDAASALPAEAPAGYFETFPARVRARLQPRRAAFPVRRVPVWTWAAAAALLLAVITPLTWREIRPAARETRTSEPPASAAAVPKTTHQDRQLEEGAPAPRAGPAPPAASRARPSAPAPLRRAERPLAAPPVTEAAPREERDQAAEGGFAPEPSAAVGGVVPQQAASREKAERVAPRSGITAESAPPVMSAANAGPEATLASRQAEEDAFRRLEAVRPRTPEGWRRVREQWSALAAAEADPVRADEARVRAIVAALEAWRGGGGEGDEAAFRAQAESYLRRDDARQRPRVERLLAEATARPAP
jgi:hypothetical protein